MDAAAELGRNLASKHQIQSEYGDRQANPSRETKFSDANAHREIYVYFPVQLTTSRTGNLTYPVDPYSCHMCGHTSMVQKYGIVSVLCFLIEYQPFTYREGYMICNKIEIHSRRIYIYILIDEVRILTKSR